MRSAVIRDGIVDNIIELDDQATYTPAAGIELVTLTDEPCDIGWTYNGQTFTDPNPPELFQP
jgi:hypothetical protein